MHIKEGITLAPYTTFNIGGTADYFVCVKNREELQEAVAWAHQQKLPITVIAGGSNVLIADEGIRGLVIKNDIGEITYTEKGDIVEVCAGAGIVWDALVAEAVARELWGIENLSHIPGSVGATPIQNVGAYGVEVADVITAVGVFNTETMEAETLSPEACRFGYRDSLFKHDGGRKYIVLAVTYALSKVPKPNVEYKDLAERFGEMDTPSLADIRSAVIEIRGKKFPDWHTIGTAGSFFKNPIVSNAQFENLQNHYPGMPGFSVAHGVKVPLGWILEHVCNLRGVREGTVGTYEGQALVLINYGDASAEDVIAFAKQIEGAVHSKTDVAVSWEVTKLGFDD